MGSCLSSSTMMDSSSLLSSSKVITLNGTLREYSIAVTASEILESETTPCFVCNSDRLYYDEFIEPLKPKEELQFGQIYFILPISRLQYRLSASDMAGLAVKASSALVRTSSSKTRRVSWSSGSGSGRGRRIRISPDMEMTNNQKFGGEMKKFEKSTVGISKSGSVKKLQRNASRRAKIAIRSFRMKLSTIYEGSVVD